MLWNSIELPDKNIYFRDEDNLIYCADCRDILPLIPDKSIDLVLTSPPYDDLRLYGGKGFRFEGLPLLIYKVLDNGACCVWIVGDQTINGSESGNSFRQALCFMDSGFNLHDTMIYSKLGNPPFTESSKRYVSVFEYMFVLSKDSPKIFNPIKDKLNRCSGESRLTGTRRQRNGKTIKTSGFQIAKWGLRANIWQYDVGFLKGAKDKYVYDHPAIFPESLAFDHIISWSNPNDIVLDPFLGSGTTAYCAKKLGRKCIGIEISEKYCEIAVERLRQSVMKLE